MFQPKRMIYVVNWESSVGMVTPGCPNISRKGKLWIPERLFYLCFPSFINLWQVFCTQCLCGWWVVPWLKRLKKISKSWVINFIQRLHVLGKEVLDWALQFAPSGRRFWEFLSDSHSVGYCKLTPKVDGVFCLPLSPLKVRDKWMLWWWCLKWKCRFVVFLKVFNDLKHTSHIPCLLFLSGCINFPFFAGKPKCFQTSLSLPFKGRSSLKWIWHCSLHRTLEQWVS